MKNHKDWKEEQEKRKQDVLQIYISSKLIMPQMGTFIF